MQRKFASSKHILFPDTGWRDEHANVSEIQALEPPRRRKHLDGVSLDTPNSCGACLFFTS